MGHGHSHSALRGSAAPVDQRARALLAGALILVAIATASGVLALWPDRSAIAVLQEAAQGDAPGVTYPRAEVLSLEGDQLTVRLPEAGEVTFPVPPQVAAAGLEPGDDLRLMRIPGADGRPDNYSYWTLERHRSLAWLALVFLIVVAAVARTRGLRALVGLAISAAVILGFMLPALLTGADGIAIALVGSSAIMFVVLYLTHGLNLRTSAALAGTLLGILVTAALGWWAVDATRLTGVSEEGGRVLMGQAGGLDFQGLLVCAVIIAGLGILNDVTITQSSAVWELRAAAPEQSRMEIFQSAMRIGRDHIASTIYTMTFAYTGAALTTLMALLIFAQPALQLISAEELAQEIVQTLVSGIGLVLAVPATTAIAALVLSSSKGAPARGRPQSLN